MKKQMKQLLVALTLGWLSFSVSLVAPVQAQSNPRPSYVFGADNRLAVPDTTKTPYSSIVRIEAIFAGQVHVGTGVMVSPNKVLTAGHLLYNRDLDAYVEQITVYPGQTGDVRPFGAASMTKYELLDSRFVDEFRNRTTTWGNYDIGLITLAQPIGYQTGYLGLSSQVTPHQVYTSVGYPGDLSLDTDVMYSVSGQLAAVHDKGLEFYLDTFGGQSGSPIYNAKNQVVGLVSGEWTDGWAPNFAVRLTDTYINQIKLSIATDAPKEKGKPIYRLYNPLTGLHFYTASRSEHDHLVRLGWKSEALAWYAPSSGNPVYRLYNPNGGTHHFTVSEVERHHLIKVGWKNEGIAFYSGGDHTIYRMYNPHTGEHFYTLNASERDHLVKLGWKYEGLAFKAQSSYE